MSGNAEVSSSVMERKCGATIVTQKMKDLFWKQALPMNQLIKYQKAWMEGEYVARWAS